MLGGGGLAVACPFVPLSCGCCGGEEGGVLIGGSEMTGCGWMCVGGCAEGVEVGTAIFGDGSEVALTLMGTQDDEFSCSGWQVNSTSFKKKIVCS